MPIDHAYIELNRASTERMRTLSGRLTDAELQTRVGEHWTVAIVYAHLAWWDRRVLYVLDQSEKDGHLYIPSLEISINDISLPLWAAIPPGEAVRIAMEAAEELDRRLEAYPPALLAEIYDYNPRWVDRSRHRNEHLNEAVAALGGV